ncbi:MAG: PorP/SprF family type IX secretion system membrane protein [Bernardetiaceae bacterium]|nr:PorP/SprF family type IX secretion system membrane protein [Bernardetiaceae bacterium]
MALKKLHYLFIWCLFLGLGHHLQAQNLPLYTHHFQNPFFYNPSFAGMSGYHEANLTYRNQWAGIEGAPQSLFATYHMPISNNAGVGAQILQDQAGMFSRTSFRFSYAYKAKLNEDSDLQMGLALGAGYNGLNFNHLSERDLNDPALLRYDKSWNIESGFGAAFRHKQLQIAVALPNMLYQNFAMQEQADASPAYTNSIFRLAQQMVASISYEWELSEQGISIRPILLYRNQLLDVAQFEAGAVAEWQKMFRFGFTIRQGYGAAVMAGVTYQNLSIGYAYEIAQGRISTHSSGGHEINLAYRFGKRNDALQDTINFTPPLEEIVDNNESSDTTIADINIENPDSLITEPNVVVEIPNEEIVTDTNNFPPDFGEVYALPLEVFVEKTTEITSDAIPMLEQIAVFLEENPNTYMEIAVHTGLKGSPGEQRTLSEKQAEVLVNYFSQKGIAKRRLSTFGYGSTMPLSNSNDAINRRVEIKITR